MAAPNPADQPPASAPAGHDQGAALNQDPYWTPDPDRAVRRHAPWGAHGRAGSHLATSLLRRRRALA